jgi:N-acetylmuramoyl-L-alanine amidase
VVAFPSGLAAATPRIRSFRHYTAPDHTRVVIELDAAARFVAPRPCADGRCVVIEIPGVDADPFRLPVQDGVVDAIEVLVPVRGTTVVRVTVMRDIDYVAFPLAPNAGGGGHRIVLDLNKRLTAAERSAEERHVESIRQSGDVVVAIDAGHGGNDPGCSGNGVTEKDVALDVALLCAAALSRRPRFRAVLTRDKDYFVPLGRRQQIAQKFGAQVFVSIHCNSARRPTARGGEVFFVSLEGAADKAAKELIDRENAADLVGGVPPGMVETPLVGILVNLKQNQVMRQSEKLAEVVLRRLEQVQGGEIRGLRQGPLAVLKSISCPSVLVELGFVTNRRDARMLADHATKETYARQLAAAIEEYVRG